MTDALIRTLLLTFLLMSAPHVNAVNDPTRPQVMTRAPEVVEEKVEQPEAEIQLQQILISASGNKAVINSRVVKTGETVDGAKVLSITSDTVVVNYRQNRKKLSLINKTKDVVR